MKTALLLSILAAFTAVTTSCRTAIPMDPNTLKLSCKCMPQNYQAPGPADCGQVVYRPPGRK